MSSIPTDNIDDTNKPYRVIESGIQTYPLFVWSSLIRHSSVGIITDKQKICVAMVFLLVF